MKLTLGGYNTSLIADIRNVSTFNEKLISWYNITPSLSGQKYWSFSYQKVFMNDSIILESKLRTAYFDMNYTNIRVPYD